MIPFDRWCFVQKSLDVDSLSANTTEEQDFTVTGLKVGDLVVVNKPSHSTGAMIGNARVKAANTLSITFGNLTGSAIDPAAETYDIWVFRPEKKLSTVQL
jgi:hypothetical protein